MIRYIKENNDNIIEMPLECIEGATLLSKEEYEEYENNIPLINNWWWLRSAGFYNNCAYSVNYAGNVDSYYSSVYRTGGGIRPALILDIQYFNLEVGDKFEFGEHLFTIISNDLAICDDFIGNGCFREDWKSEGANIYEKSDVKKVVDNWFNNSYNNENSMIKIMKSDSSFFKEDDWGF